ncbi:7-deoxyloganetic acid glucosyltransferase-like [Telopea speciosissima]|uniref:7-deoxyloganetic acid glucosyltransferase-like n=1 Tax=Telopea speciosissima TaxID=54955 RepID=UPI001CC440E7|nr:7-deoxyloganetic acid glucosyltransferase-like [Telopea speciosissima]
MEREAVVPHVLIFPFPAQGHMNSMLKLAELLCPADFYITFLNSDHNHKRLLRFTDAEVRFRHWPKFRFESITDGLPDDDYRSSERTFEMFNTLESITRPLFRELIISLSRPHQEISPLSCIIADGIIPLAIDVAEELNIPIISFRTISACSFWAYFCIPKLIAAGELPFQGDMDVPIKCVPGTEGFLRRRDLPRFCRTEDLNDHVFQAVLMATQKTTRASALILNSFEDLEGPILSEIRSHLPNLYAIGPLHAHSKTRLLEQSLVSPLCSNSLWEVDRSCMKWLDSRPPESVVYVSFGSLAVVDRETLLEFWYGLVRSGKPFLWVVRPDSVTGGEVDDKIPGELVEGTTERGCIVGWAPQEEVLAHPAVGGFLTHSGWNSTLESIYAGVPMICWPYFADQQINSRFVSEVWRVGVDMKDTCDRVIVEKMVKDVMERREELMGSVDKLAKLARSCVSQGGSSRSNVDRLIQDIRSMARS